MPENDDELCPQAWHMGLVQGLLVECRFKARHRGQHRNAKGTLAWSGKLTPGEAKIRDRLRKEAIGA